LIAVARNDRRRKELEPLVHAQLPAMEVIPVAVRELPGVPLRLVIVAALLGGMAVATITAFFVDYLQGAPVRTQVREASISAATTQRD
jgi:hypothetical protein